MPDSSTARGTSSPVSMAGHFANRLDGISSSGIRRIFELGAQLENPIDLSIGQADFDVPEPVKAAAIDAIQSGHNRYTVTQGIPELNDGIRARVGASRGYEPEATLVTSGVSGGLFLGMLSLVNPGDEVLLPEPYFTMYTVLVTLVGGTAVHYDTYPSDTHDGFDLDVDEIRAKITPRTKVILVNSPSNPTGVVFSREKLADLARVAEANDLVVISDEIYDLFVYDGAYPSIASLYPKTLIVSGFTKTYGMPGWRVGYSVGPAELIDRMKTLQQFTYVCAPSMAQQGCLAALDVDVTPYRDEYREKRDLMIAGLSDDYDVQSPGGSFYMFPRVPDRFDSDVAFVEKALEQNLLIVPGSAFSARNTHFRISFAAPNDRLKDGIDVLRRLANG